MTKVAAFLFAGVSLSALSFSSAEALAGECQCNSYCLIVENPSHVILSTATIRGKSYSNYRSAKSEAIDSLELACQNLLKNNKNIEPNVHIAILTHKYALADKRVTELTAATIENSCACD